MNVVRTALPEVLILEPRVFGDERGFFLESFNRRAFDDLAGSHHDFVQDNHSRSTRGVLRGLHYQLPPHAQGKLVRVARGRVFDVVVDIRRASPRFGQWVGMELSDANHHQLWIPPGFAHAFLALDEVVDFLYKTTDYYAPGAERCIRWDDSSLGIAWPDIGMAPIVSIKDAQGLALNEAEVFA